MKRDGSNHLGLPGGGHLGPNEASPAKSQSLVTLLDCWLVRRLMAMTGDAPIAIKLWNGEIVYRPLSAPVATLTIRDRGTLLGLLLSPRFAFGDGFSTGRLEVRGNLVECLEAAYRGLNNVMPPDSLHSKIGTWLRPSRSTSLQSARRNIQHHYDLGNDFYRLWLDEAMVYTCAYYDSPEASLEEAQIAKMDHVCRKLELTPGQTVVEAGCGWGTLALHMAKHYGAKVRAFNISIEQIRYARERARAEGLEDRVEFVEDDYRNIRGKFDAVVSVGMLEHVGLDNFKAFGAVIHNALKPGGRGLADAASSTASDATGPCRTIPGSSSVSFQAAARRACRR
jgi:cyclopropane-fatty-acyl-phospholipid synthase